MQALVDRHPDRHPRSALSARALECTRGERRLFGHLSFELVNGALLQVRGTNGSGKTSLLRMVCGLLAPVSGTIAWNGRPIGDAREDFNATLSYVGHLNGIKDELDPVENLRLSATLAGLRSDAAAVRAALVAFGLGGLEHLPCKVFSQGQRRRLALARLALSTTRALWVLDEPFAALDGAGIGSMCSLLEDHLARGGMALLTTHQDVPIAAPGLQTLTLGATGEGTERP